MKRCRPQRPHLCALTAGAALCVIAFDFLAPKAKPAAPIASTIPDSAAVFRYGDVVPASVEKIMGGVCRFGQDVFVVWEPDGDPVVSALDADSPIFKCHPTSDHTAMTINGLPTTFYTMGEFVEFEKGFDI